LILKSFLVASLFKTLLNIATTEDGVCGNCSVGCNNINFKSIPEVAER
jgi:hypothetical protein